MQNSLKQIKQCRWIYSETLQTGPNDGTLSGWGMTVPASQDQFQYGFKLDPLKQLNGFNYDFSRWYENAL